MDEMENGGKGGMGQGERRKVSGFNDGNLFSG